MFEMEGCMYERYLLWYVGLTAKEPWWHCLKQLVAQVLPSSMVCSRCKAIEDFMLTLCVITGGCIVLCRQSYLAQQSFLSNPLWHLHSKSTRFFRFLVEPCKDNKDCAYMGNHSCFDMGLHIIGSCLSEPICWCLTQKWRYSLVSRAHDSLRRNICLNYSF